MLAGIGVDIVQIDRVRALLQRHPERFPARILTSSELTIFEQRERSVHYLASRFAAKEAASKALGTGIAKGVGFHGIEVVSDEAGKPGLVFHAAADDLLQKRGIVAAWLSLSDEQDYCVAMVVLETAR